MFRGLVLSLCILLVAAPATHAVPIVDGRDCVSASGAHGVCTPGRPEPVVGVEGYYSYTCAMLEGKKVDCYGAFNDDLLEGDVVDVAAGSGHFCALSDSGNVRCYGSNWEGQSEGYSGGDVVDVAAGAHDTCFLKKSSTVSCAGWVLSQGAYSGDQATMLQAYYMHACVLLRDGNVECWGQPESAAAPYAGGDAIGLAVGTYSTCALLQDGNVDCWGESCCYTATDYLGGDAVQVTAGGSGACVLRADSTVYCWQKLNWYPTLYETEYGPGAVAVRQMSSHTCIVRANGSMDCHGTNGYGQSVDYPSAALAEDRPPLPTEYLHRCVPVAGCLPRLPS